jgi:hypothetical protein
MKIKILLCMVLTLIIVNLVMLNAKMNWIQIQFAEMLTTVAMQIDESKDYDGCLYRKNADD